MAKRKVERLDFNESGENRERNFTRYEMEFIPSDDLDIEMQVGDELKQAWDGVARVAVEGYKKSGRGYVAIFPNAVGRNRYTGELPYESCLKDAEVFYVTPGSERDFRQHDYLEDYNPETEIAFVIDFSDGMVKGVASLGEVLKKEQARRRRKERDQIRRATEYAASRGDERKHLRTALEGTQ